MFILSFILVIREIVDLANSWLERNPNWTVFNCETIMLYYKFNDKMSYFELKPNDTSFYIYGSEKNNVLKALRIWVIYMLFFSLFLSFFPN